MTQTPLPPPSDADVLGWRKTFAERVGVHPVSLLVTDDLLNEQTTHEEVERAWRRLGFDVSRTTDDGWSDADEVVRPVDSDGLHVPHPAVPDGYYRVEAYATEDGCVYYDVRPATDYARRCVSTMEALGWPEPLPETDAETA